MRDLFIFLVTHDLLMVQKSWQPVDMDRTHMFASWFHYLNWHNCRISKPSTRYDRCIKRKIIRDQSSIYSFKYSQQRILWSSFHIWYIETSSNLKECLKLLFHGFNLRPCLKQAFLFMLFGAFGATSAHPNFLVINVAVFSVSQKNSGPFLTSNHSNLKTTT